MDNTVAVIIGLAIGLGLGFAFAYFLIQMRQNQKLVILRNTAGQIESIIQS